MTLKDQFDVKGYDSTLGYVGRAFRPTEQDCVLVSILKEMGAIIIAKSNLPQSIMVCPQPPAHSLGGASRSCFKLSRCSGVKRIIRFGGEQTTRRIPALLLGARRAAKECS